MDVISMRYAVERGARSKRAYHDCCRVGGLDKVRTLSSWEYTVLGREVPCGRPKMGEMATQQRPVVVMAEPGAASPAGDLGRELWHTVTMLSIRRRRLCSCQQGAHRR